MKKLLLFSIFIYANQVMAQTPYSINQNTNKSNGGDDNGMGSSFKTVAAAHLDSIDVVIRTGSHSSSVVRVFNGNTNDMGSLLREETATGIPTGSEASYRIRFANSVAMNANSTYTFMVYTNPLRFGYGDSYTDGALWTGQGFLTAGEHTNADLDFIAYFGAPIVSANEEATDAEAQFIYANHTITTKNFVADEINIYDLKGQSIVSGKGESLSLNPTLTEGIYVVSIRKDKQVYTARIFVNNN